MVRSRWPRRLLSLLAIALLLPAIAAGCGQPTLDVSGTVKLSDGTPIETGQVEFQAIESDISSVGYLKPGGHFTLSTSGHEDGALAGTYRVALKPPPIPVMVPGQQDQSDRELAAREKWLNSVPESYRDAATSGIEVTIDSATDSVEIVVPVEADRD